MHRRTLLRAGAAALGGGAATAAGLSMATGAAAQTSLTLSIDGDSVTLAPDGAVAGVTLDATVEWAYDLPEGTAPETVVVELAAGTDDVVTVASAESPQLFAEASGSESFEVDLLDTEALSAAAVEPSGSGTSDTEVTVEARLRVESSGGDVLARDTATDTAVLTVTREGVAASEYGDVGGSGSLTISTE